MNEGNKPKRRQIRVYLGEEAIHKATVESEISDQISVYLSYLNVRDIAVSLNNQEMLISIKYTTTGLSGLQMLNLSISSDSTQINTDTAVSY